MDIEPTAHLADRLAQQYGIRVLNLPRLSRVELQHIAQAVADLATLMGGPRRFKSEMRWVLMSRIPLVLRIAAMALPVVDVVYFERASWDRPSLLKWQTVHELAHVWDMRKIFRLSWGLKQVTRSRYRGFAWQLPIPLKYSPGGKWLQSREPPLNSLEDWADSLATYVYPHYAESISPSRHGPGLISPARWHYVSQHMQVRLPYPPGWIPRFAEVETSPPLWYTSHGGSPLTGR